MFLAVKAQKEDGFESLLAKNTKILLFINYAYNISICYSSFRDGPLENLLGGGWGGRAKYKENIRAREN